MSRTDSDASADYWESGVEANTFRKTRTNERGNLTPKAERGGQNSPIVTKIGDDKDNGTLTKTRILQQQQTGPSTSNRTELLINGKARPETPPADYEIGVGHSSRSH
jgi:hypothetical protein